jgi:hypothetical protein
MFIQRTGFTSLQQLCLSIVGALADSGFKTLYAADDGKLFKAILQPTVAIDPILNYLGTKTWRIGLVVKDNNLHVYAGTDKHLKDTGEIVAETHLKPHDLQASEDGLPNNPALIYRFVVRDFLTGNASQTYPMSYSLSVTDHGLFLSVTDDCNDEYQSRVKPDGKLSSIYSPRFSWLLIQRPVHNGDVVLTGKAPVVCVYTKLETPINTDSEGYYTTGNNQSPTTQLPYYLTVCESDVTRPTEHNRIDDSTDRLSLSWNSYLSSDYSEQYEVNIGIPIGFNTTRYFYPYALDMIATCNSKTLVEGLEIKLVNSTYVALTTNRVQGNGMRLLVASDLPSSTQNLPQTI